jgi:hypothetical protein
MFGLILAAALMVNGHPAAQVHHRVDHVVVHTGDSLSAIGMKAHMPWTALYERNKQVIGSNPDLIQPGMHLHLPIRPSRWAARYVPPKPIVYPGYPNIPVHHHHHHFTVQPGGPIIPAGGMSGFESCVIRAESGGNAAAYNPTSGAGGLFQFLPSTWASLGLGYPGGAQTAPVSVQMEGFSILYSRDGTSPWAPYDGC